MSLVLHACKGRMELSNEYLQEGINLYKEKKYTEASKSLNQVLQIDKNSSEAYYYLALIDEDNKRWQSMFDNLTQVLLVKPSNLSARVKLANIESHGKFVDQAEKDIDIVLKEEPHNTEAILIKVYILIQKKSYLDALSLVNNVLVESPGNTQAIVLKSTILVSEKQFNQALDLVDGALKGNANDFNLNVERMHIHQEQNDIVALEEDCNKLINLFPDILEFRYALIDIYVKSNRFVDADLLYKGMVNKNIKNNVIVDRYIAFIKKYKPEDLEVVLLDLIGKSPGSSEYKLLLAESYIDSNQFAEAINDLNAVIANKSQSSSVFDNKIDSKFVLQAKAMLASIAFKEQKLSDAKSLIDEVVAVDANHYLALLVSAKIKLQEHNIDEALSILRILSKQFPDKDEQFELLGNVYVMQNMQGLADEAYRKAIEINPGNIQATVAVVNKMIEHKDFKRAEDQLNKALGVNGQQTDFIALLNKIHELN
jgi:pentatricopeptide repeat protein